MADEPQISKHHAGQHPALKSFRAFDIIPPSKVKPGHTSRPVITSQPKHFDTTLTPPKHEEPKPANATVEMPNLSEIPASAPAPETAQPEVLTMPAGSAPIGVDTPVGDITSDDGLTSSEPEKTDEQPAVQPELAVPETAPKPAPSAEAASNGDLNSILDQEAGPQTQLQHSQEFANVLKELTAQVPANGVDNRPIVAVHRHDYLRVVMQVLTWLLIVVVVVAVAMDILLDTGALKLTYNIPHTHFLGK